MMKYMYGCKPTLSVHEVKIENGETTEQDPDCGTS